MEALVANQDQEIELRERALSKRQNQSKDVLQPSRSTVRTQSQEIFSLKGLELNEENKTSRR